MLDRKYADFAWEQAAALLAIKVTAHALVSLLVINNTVLITSAKTDAINCAHTFAFPPDTKTNAKSVNTKYPKTAKITG